MHQDALVDLFSALRGMTRFHSESKGVGDFSQGRLGIAIIGKKVGLAVHLYCRMAQA